MRRFLILKYNDCESGSVCQMVIGLFHETFDNKYIFQWNTGNDVYGTFNIILQRLDENGEVAEILFDNVTSNKSYEVLKSFLGSGDYRFSVRTICGNDFSGFQHDDFTLIKTIPTALQQNLIG